MVSTSTSARTGRSLALGLLTALAVGAAPRAADAFSVTTLQPGLKTIVAYGKTKITWYMHKDASTDMPYAQALDAVQKSFDGWQDVSCSAIEFQQGYFCNTALGKCLFSNSSCAKDADCPAAQSKKLLPMGYNPNGRNEVVWIEDSKWTFGQYVLGVTVPMPNFQAKLQESDIAFNGYHYKWTNDAGQANQNGWQHIQSVGIHEIGHFIGIHHVLGGFSQFDPPTMAPNVWPSGISATLNADDQQAACYLYPEGGSYTCQGDDDCPHIVQQGSQGEYYEAKLVCQAGGCVWGGAVGGDGQLGDPCTSNQSCASPCPGGGIQQGCNYCQNVAGSAYCTRLCLVNNPDCPSGLDCYPYQGGQGYGACLPSQGGGSSGDKGEGEACAATEECQSLMLCLDGLCRVQCQVGGDGAECKASQYCETIPGGGGVCVDGFAPGSTPNGEVCQGNESCASGLCMKNDLQDTVAYCRATCTGKGTCPDGFACAKQAAGIQGCLPGDEKWPAGTTCEFASDCISGLCIEVGGQKMCSASCELGVAGQCPCGMTCADTTAGPLCLEGPAEACLAIGADCSADSECASDLCLDGICQPACDVPTGEGACLTGQGCLRLGPTTTRGVCSGRGSGLLGAPCDSDLACGSLLCEADQTSGDTTRRCLAPCWLQAPSCGASEGCVAVYDDLGVCLLGAEDSPPPAADAGGAGGQDAGGGVGGADVGGGGAIGGGVADGGAGSSGCTLRAGAATQAAGPPMALWLLGLVTLGWAWRRRQRS